MKSKMLCLAIWLLLQPWCALAQEIVDRFPVLISEAKEKVIVRSTQSTFFYFEICEAPLERLQSRLPKLIEYLNHSPLACLRINNATLPSSDLQVAESLDRVFRIELFNQITLQTASHAGFATVSQSAAIINYVFAVKSFAARSPKLGLLSLVTGFIFQGRTAFDMYRAYQSWQEPSPALSLISLQTLNADAAPLATVPFFEAFVGALDNVTRLVYSAKYPSPNSQLRSEP